MHVTQPVLPGLQPMGSGPIVLTSDGAPISALSPQESLLYPSLFKIALGPKAILTSSVIPASTASNFLKRSGLSKKFLHDIWNLSDSADNGYLTPEGFFKACRLVAHAQCGALSITSDLLCQEPQTLPYFDGAESGEDGVWKLSESEIASFAAIYRKEGGDLKLDGSDARALLMRSGLSNSELCDIWDLADADKDGKLTFGEFLVAMQLVNKVRDSKAFIPSQLPEVLKGYLRTPLPSLSAAPVPESPPSQAPGTPRGFGSSVVSHPVFEPLQSKIEIPTSPAFGSRAIPFVTEPKLAAPSPTLLERELATEQRNVIDSIGRSRQFRKQAMEGRARLAALRDDAKKAEIALVSADHEVERVQDQILTLKQQIVETEDELEAFRRETGQLSLSTGNGDVVQAVSSIRASIGDDEREVLELRAQLERVQREKIDLQSSLQVLTEKKRQGDQDRNLMLVGLENERAKLVAVRAERLQLWEQRHQVTRELTTKTFDQLAGANVGKGVVIPSSAADMSPKRPMRDRKGVKADSSAAPEWNSNPQWSPFGSNTVTFPHM